MKTLIKNKIFKRSTIYLLVLSFVMLGFFAYKVNANPDATITPASGGTAVSIDTTSPEGTGSWTTLSGPTIAEGNAGEIVAGVHTLTLPAGWEFNTGQDVTIAVSGDATQITLVNATVTPTLYTLSFEVTSVSADNPSSLAFSNVQVRPTGTTSGTTGNITYSGEGITGIDGSTNFGTLATVAGEVTQLAITTQPTNTVYGSNISNIILKTQDQFGNNSTSGLGETETVTATLASGDGTLSGTLTGDISSGSLTFSDLTITQNNHLALGSHTLTFSHDTYTNDTSDSFDITAKAITATVTVSDKTYDGNTDASISGASPSGEVSGDSVTIDYSGATATFDQKTVDTGVAVNVTGLVLAGDDAGLYTFASGTASTTANITQKDLTVTAPAITKTYDGTTNATGTSTVETLVTGDAVSTEPTLTFDNKNIGTEKTLTPSGIIIKDSDGTGNDMTGNYNITYTPNTTSSINKRDITLTAVTDTKTYDGDTTSSETPTITSGTLASGDVGVYSQTFDNKTATTSKTLTPAVTSIEDGSSADMTGNYNVTLVNDTTGVINKKELTVSGATVTSKTYDGNTDAVISGATLSGVVGGDTVTFVADTDTVGTFNDKNVETGKSVTTNMAIEGADSGNYTLTQPTLTGDITAKNITITAITETKIYNGTTDSSKTPTLTSGTLASGDSATYIQSFDSKNVGSRTITPTAEILDGSSEDMTANYNITQTTASGTINQKTLTVTAPQIIKVYDATTNATGTSVVETLVVGDSVSTEATLTFDNKNVGTGKTVTPSAIAIEDGESADMTANYNIGYVANTSSSITEATLTVSGAIVTSKIYDGNTDAVISGATLSGILESDDVSLGNHTSGTFASENIGTHSVSTTPMTISGDDASNYTLTQPTLTGDITAKELTIGGSFTANDKIYDGGLTATIDDASTLTLSGIVSEEDVSLTSIILEFASKDVGATITVNIDSAALNGDDKDNYTLSLIGAPTTTAAITQLDTSGSFTVEAEKIYDDTNTATVLTRVVDNKIGSDLVSLDGGTATYDSVHVGTDKTVALSGATLIGDDAGNYNLTGVSTTTADITARTVNVTAQTDTKAYDDTTSSSVSPVGAALQGDDTYTTHGIQTFDTKFIGTEKTLTPSGSIINDGNGGNNYSINYVTNETGEIHAASLAGFNINVSTSSPNSGVPFDLTITAVDDFGNTISAANGVTPYDGVVLVTTSAVAPYDISPSTYPFVAGDEGTVTFTDGITLNTVEDGVSVNVRDYANSTITGSVTDIDVTDNSDTVSPIITAISETPAQTTADINFTSDEAGLTKIGYGLSDVHGNMTSYVTMTADDQNLITLTGLTCETTYHYTVYGKDNSGNEDNTVDSTFTTLDCTNEPSEISSNARLVKRIATKNGVHADGWRWEIDVTLPSDVSDIQMSFDNLTGAGTIAAENFHFYSEQSTGNKVRGNAIDANVLAGAGTNWSAGMAIDTGLDLDSDTAGRQIVVVVEVAVPTTSADGYYSASYDIQELSVE